MTLCNTCHKAPPAPKRKSCPACLARDRAKWRRKSAARKAKNLCVRCGKGPPRPGRTECADCACKAAERARGGDADRVRARYWARIEAGTCVQCGAVPPLEGLRLCAGCRDKINARTRALRAGRKAKGLCTECGAPSEGKRLCEGCDAKARHAQARFKTLPVWEPRFAVYSATTGALLETLESREDVALFLAFAKLDRDAVEVVTDAPLSAAYAGMP